MKSKIVKVVLLFVIAITGKLTAAEFPLVQLKNYADGLNIEEGTIYRKHHVTHLYNSKEPKIL